MLNPNVHFDKYCYLLIFTKGTRVVSVSWKWNLMAKPVASLAAFRLRRSDLAKREEVHSRPTKAGILCRYILV